MSDSEMDIKKGRAYELLKRIYENNFVMTKNLKLEATELMMPDWKKEFDKDEREEVTEEFKKEIEMFDSVEEQQKKIDDLEIEVDRWKRSEGNEVYYVREYAQKPIDIKKIADNCFSVEPERSMEEAVAEILAICASKKMD
jgi:hypothetical protein